MGTVTRPELSTKNQYWLPRHRYFELKHFCLQYADWKKRYQELGFMPGLASERKERISGGQIFDPTSDYAEERLYYHDLMDMVEKTAQETVPELSKWLLKAVTEGLSYEHAMPPCCREVWYAAYRRFFWLLDRARKKQGG